jgi:EmrB/QacA subfamily drug resistance transporter
VVRAPESIAGLKPDGNVPPARGCRDPSFLILYVSYHPAASSHAVRHARRPAPTPGTNAQHPGPERHPAPRAERQKDDDMPGLHRKWWTLIAVCTAIFMLLLDITIVNVALPSIQRSLHASFSDLQWVVDAYALTLAAFMLTAGVIGDMFGRREMFAIGLGIFSVSSFVCGVSVDSLMLNLARAAQGVGGAVMFATSLALIAEAFQGRERGTAFGIYGAVVGGAVAIGPLLGGAITSAIGWRWIFFVNVPIGVVAILITLARVQESRDPTGRRVDWFGFLSFSGSLFLLVLALVRADTDGWGSALIVSLFSGAAVLMAAFIVGEVRQRDPMLDLSLFRRPAMVGVSMTAFTISASIFAMFLYLTLFIQDDLGYSPFAAGLRFLPISMLAFAVAPVAGKLTQRVHARYMLGSGLILVAVGCLLMAFLSSTSGWTALLPGFVVAGVGIGMVNPVLASSAVAVVRPERSGMASGANNTFRQVGIATGIAALGTIFESQVRQKVTSSLLSTPAGSAAARQHGKSLATALVSGEVRTRIRHWPAAQAHAVLAAYRGAFATSMDHLFFVAAGIALVGAVLSYVLVRQRDFVAFHAPQAGGPTGGAAGQEGGPGGGSGGSRPSSGWSGPNGSGSGTVPVPASTGAGTNAPAGG